MLFLLRLYFRNIEQLHHLSDETYLDPLATEKSERHPAPHHPNASVCWREI